MTTNRRPVDQLIVALDFPNTTEAINLVKMLGDSVQWYKIGFELYMGEGPDAVRALLDCGKHVFLDLKFHDIPNTVAGASRVISKLGVSIFNVHTQGGGEMMRAAKEAAAEGADAAGHPVPQVYGVTMLTSINDNTTHVIGYDRSASEQALHLARLAHISGLDGVVASPQEITVIRKAIAGEFGILTPGVRPAGSDMQDQKRVATPGKAVADGATYIVVGRAITQAPDPRAARSEERRYGMEYSASWSTDRSGHELGGCCLQVALRDYARFGQFVLEGGRIGSRSIVPEGWFEGATDTQVDFESSGRGYGYQWWTSDDGTFRAIGIHGQLLHVDRRRELVVVINSAWPEATSAERSAVRDELLAAIAQAIDQER